MFLFGVKHIVCMEKQKFPHFKKEINLEAF